LERRGLIGDYLYLSRKEQDEDRKFCDRVFLHARLLQFVPHGDEDPVRIECGYPAELTTVLRGLTEYIP
jgi:23S rRNA-/tRNA-specific pseudouridylate synthase